MEKKVLEYYSEAIKKDYYLSIKITNKELIEENKIIENEQDIKILAVSEENKVGKDLFFKKYKEFIDNKINIKLYWAPYLLENNDKDEKRNEYIPFYSIEFNKQINKLEELVKPKTGILSLNLNLSNFKILDEEMFENLSENIEKKFFGTTVEIKAEEQDIYTFESLIKTIIEETTIEDYLIKQNIKPKTRGVFYFINEEKFSNKNLINKSILDLYKEVENKGINTLLKSFLYKNKHKTKPAIEFFEPDNKHSIHITRLDEYNNISNQLGSFNKENKLTKSQKYALSSLETNAPIIPVNGPPGTGKTALLRAVVANYSIKNALNSVEYFKEHKKVKLMPPIASFSTNGKALENIIEGISEAFFEIKNNKNNTEIEKILYKKWLNPSCLFQKTPPIKYPKMSEETYKKQLEEHNEENKKLSELNGFIEKEELKNSLYVPFLTSKTEISDKGKVKIVKLPTTILTSMLSSIESKNEEYAKIYINNSKLVIENILKDKSFEEKIKKIFKTKKSGIRATTQLYDPYNNDLTKILLIIDILYEKLNLYNDYIKEKQEIIKESLDAYYTSSFKKIPILHKLINKIRENFKMFFHNDIDIEEANNILFELSEDETTEKVNNYYYSIHILEGLLLVRNILNKEQKVNKNECPECKKGYLNRSKYNKDEVYCNNCKLNITRTNITDKELSIILEKTILEKNNFTYILKIDKEKNKGYINQTNHVNKEKLELLSAFFPILNTTAHSFPTQYSLNGKPVEKDFFDLMLIDEAGMVLPSLMINLYAGKRAVFFGDTKQIKAITPFGGRVNIDKNLFYKIVEKDDILHSWYSLLEQSAMSMANESSYLKNDNELYKTDLEGDLWLKEHFRCKDNIIGFCNELVYDGFIEPKKGCKKENNIIIINHEFEESNKINIGEGELIINLIKKYIKKGYKTEDIGIITPFKNQEIYLNKELEKENIKGLVCGTVHKFQGSERKIIIFSTTVGINSELKKELFINRDDGNLLNVAVSRAKDKFILIGHLNRLKKDENSHSGKLVSYTDKNGIILNFNKEFFNIENNLKSLDI